MNETASSAREILERLVQQSGITKKLATQILHTIPDIIEEGLKKDGEVRVKGLGTFRLRWTRGKVGRNPKTGERVEIPSHNRVIFLPEKALKEYINRDNRLLSYKIIPTDGEVTVIDKTTGIVEQYQYQYQEQYHTEPEPLHEKQPENVIETDIETEPLPLPPRRKRRVHWIVPVAVGVIIILSGLFYWRNFHTSRQSVVGSRQSSVVSQQGVESNSKSEISNPKSELKTPARTTDVVQSGGQNSKLKTIPAGTRLFRLARETYGNPYLWVLIYKENQDKIPNPDMLISGRELAIPVLEGTPDHLSRNDSLAVSEGYRFAYEYFKAKDDPRVKDFFRAMKQYKPF